MPTALPLLRPPGCAYQAHGRVYDSDMTYPDRDPVSRAQELENIVDQLDETVANEREAEGARGKPSDREGDATRGATEEPPD